MRNAVMLALLLLPCGCQTPAPSNPVADRAECPEPPADLSPIEEVRQLSQEAREARANLMVSLGHEGGLFATLHPLELSLIEAVLAEPAKARQLDPAWLRKNLLRTTVEIHSSKPLETFDGDLREAFFADEKGQRFPAIGLGVRSDSHGWTYRFLLDPRPLHTEKDARLRFEVPGDTGKLEASWALLRRMLDGLEEQPIVFHLSRLRELRWARWEALSGSLSRARNSVDDLVACAPELAEAQQLKRALSSPPSARLNGEELRLAAGAPQLAADPSQDTIREVALRAQLLLRLGEGFSRGLLRPEGLSAAQQELRRAVSALAESRPSRGGAAAEEQAAAALLAFDRRLAQLLAEGLDVGTRPFKPQPVRALRLLGGPALAGAEVDSELGRRLALASSGLLPQRVPAVQGRAADRQVQLYEMRPLLEAEVDGERQLAKPHLRLGRGWLHPGLPDLRFKISLQDHGAEYWGAEAARATSLAALGTLATRLLEQELSGPNDSSAELAMLGLVELGATKAKARLLLLLDAGPARAASALRALAMAGGQDAAAALLRGARSTRPEVRAAALEGLGRLGRPEDRELIRAGLRDGDASVAVGAMIALLRLKDPEAVKLARGWLGRGGEGDDQRRQGVLRAAAGPGGLPVLGKELLRLLRGAATERGVVAAVARSLDAASAAPLSRLYSDAPAALRREILDQARGQAYQGLLLRAATETDLELRSQALARLAELKQPPRGPFTQALESKEKRLQLLGNMGLARLGEPTSLLALAEAARNGSCEERALVVNAVAVALDAASRVRMLRADLASRCAGLEGPAWQLVVKYHPQDLSLLRAGFSNRQRHLRVQAALLALGLRRGAALGLDTARLGNANRH